MRLPGYGADHATGDCVGGGERDLRAGMRLGRMRRIRRGVVGREPGGNRTADRDGTVGHRRGACHGHQRRRGGRVVGCVRICGRQHRCGRARCHPRGRRTIAVRGAPGRGRDRGRTLGSGLARGRRGDRTPHGTGAPADHHLGAATRLASRRWPELHRHGVRHGRALLSHGGWRPGGRRTPAGPGPGGFLGPRFRCRRRVGATRPRAAACRAWHGRVPWSLPYSCAPAAPAPP